MTSRIGFPASNPSFFGNGPFRSGQPRFSGLTDGIRGRISRTAGGEGAAKPKLIQGSVMQGFERVLRMTFMRPRGYAELALHFTSLGVTALILPVKHFLEGLIGADSLFIPRRLASPMFSPSGAKGHGGRTIFGAIRESFFGGKKAAGQE